jgi:hypothetical protein
MFTVTVCGALTAGLVPVGTPNERSVGETVTVCAFALAPQMPPAITKPANARTNILQTLIAASLRGFPITSTIFSLRGLRPRPLSCALGRFEGTGTCACADQRNDCGRNCHSPIPAMSRKNPIDTLRSSSTTVARHHRSVRANNPRCAQAWPRPI